MSESTAARRFLDPGAEEFLARMPRPRRALFLDRDGVINEDIGYVHRAEQTRWLPGIFDLVRAAAPAGYLPIVVTNQAGIARGIYTEDQFLAYTRWLHCEFAGSGAPILATFYCPHHPVFGIGPMLRDCDCRKPRPGMILAAGRRFDLDLGKSVLIGNMDSDIEAARGAGVGGLHKIDAASPDPILDAARWLQSVSQG